MRGPFGEEAVHERGDLGLDEREYVPEFLQAFAALGRPVLDPGQPSLRDLPELPVDAARAGQELLERLGRDAEVLTSVAPSRGSPDHPGAGEDARRAADRAAAGVERLGEVGRRLFGRVADEQPAPHPAGHRRHAVAGQDLAHLLDEAFLGVAHEVGCSHLRTFQSILNVPY